MIFGKMKSLLAVLALALLLAPAARGAPGRGYMSRFGRNITSCGQAAMRMISNHIVHK